MVKVSAPEIIKSVNIVLHDSTGLETLLDRVMQPIEGRTEGLYITSFTVPDQVGSSRGIELANPQAGSKGML